jgi:hypothetical protein
MHALRGSQWSQELARPMPTRHELAVAHHRSKCLVEPGCYEPDETDYDYADEFLEEVWPGVLGVRGAES